MESGFILSEYWKTKDMQCSLLEVVRGSCDWMVEGMGRGLMSCTTPRVLSEGKNWRSWELCEVNDKSIISLTLTDKPPHAVYG